LRRLVSRLRNTSDEPLMLSARVWVAEEPPRQEKPARYAGEIEFVDRHVGVLLDDLKRRGLYDDSVIVFTSDHGDAFGEHGMWGHRAQLYDELLHVPLVIKPPAGESTTSAHAALTAARGALVRHVDVVPTVLELLGLPPLPGQQGRSLLEGGERLLVAGTHREHQTFDDADADTPGDDVVAVRDEVFKLLFYRREDRFEMYDLRADPGEQVDVFRTRGAERAAWQDRLREAAGRLAEIDHSAWREELTDDDRTDLENLGYLGADDDEPPKE
jgi:arylsulfatase A-like enzyme